MDLKDKGVNTVGYIPAGYIFLYFSKIEFLKILKSVFKTFKMKLRVCPPNDFKLIINSLFFSLKIKIYENRLPFPSFPPIILWRSLITDAILIAILSYVVTMSLGRIFAAKHNYEIDANQA